MIKKIVYKFKSPTSRTLISNFISLSVIQGVNFILPFVTLPYLARVLGVEKFGVLAFATSVIMYFLTIVDFGFNLTSVRDVSKCRDDKDEVSKIFSEVFFAKIFLLLISFFLLFCLIQSIPYFNENKEILYYTYLMVPGYVLFPEWFFQAIEKMKYITFISCIPKVIFTMLIFVVVKNQSDYIWQPLFIAAGFFVSGIISLIYVIKKFKVKIYVPKYRDIFLRLKYSSNMFITLLLPNLYTNFSIIYLNYSCGSAVGGIFDGGYKFSGATQRITDILSRVFYPFLARRMDKHNLFAGISLGLNAFFSLALFFGAEFLIKLFLGAEFKDSVLVLKIFSITPFFLSLMNTYGVNYLVLYNKDNVLRNILIFCSVLGLFLSILLINLYGYIGAAITISFIWIVRGLLTYFYHLKHKRAIKKNNI